MAKTKRIFPFIKQAGMMECGTTCLAMIFKYYGYHNIRTFLSEKAEVNLEGIDLYTISELGESFGFETEGYQMEYKHFSNITLPCIAHYDGNHFVVVYKVTENQVWIADPAVGKYTLNKKEFETRWNGVVLTFNPTPNLFKESELTEEVTKLRKDQKEIVKKFYLGNLFKSKKFLYQVVVGTLMLQLLGLALPFFTQAIVDHVLVNESYKLLYAILIGLGLVFVTQIVLSYSRNLLLAQFKVTFERSFFSGFFEHFIKLQQSYFDRHKREDFINRFQENLKIRKALSSSVLEAIIDTLFVLLYLGVLFLYHSTLGLIVLGFVIVYVSLSFLFFPRLKNLENQIFAENVKTMGHFMDTLLGIQSVRLLGIEKFKYWKWRNQYTKNLNKVLETEKSYISLSTLLTGVFFLSQAVIYWVGAYYTFTDAITIGQYIAYITIFTILINSLQNITRLGFIFTELSVTFDKVNDVLVQNTTDEKLATKPIEEAPDIIVNHLSFKYRQREEKNILSDINLHIPFGSKVGVVGRNGSGKSTLVKVLTRFYENYSGEIKYGTTPMGHIRVQEFRRKVFMIPQEVFLFDGTIKENILFGNLNASDEEVIKAATMADLHDFVKEQHLGYNLKIGENGVKLSGGQKLKVAFARLFVANPDIIILDEASSALDISTEKKIMTHVQEKFHEKTVISIAHRIHTLKSSDMIIVIDQGRIVEMGNHQQLIDQKGVYEEFTSTYINF